MAWLTLLSALLSLWMVHANTRLEPWLPSDVPHAEATMHGFDWSGVICLRGRYSTGNNLTYAWTIIDVGTETLETGTCKFTYQLVDEVCCKKLTGDIIGFELTVTDDIAQTDTDTVSLVYRYENLVDGPVTKKKVKRTLRRLRRAKKAAAEAEAEAEAAEEGG